MIVFLVAVVSGLIGLGAGVVIGGRAGWLALLVAGRVLTTARQAAPPELRRVSASADLDYAA